jgi:lactoylglutathione lyase
MRYLHTMIRISDIDESLDFFVNKLGMEEVYRYESEQGRFTNIFLGAPNDNVGSAPEEKKQGMSGYIAPVLELTYNWDPEKYEGGRNFGHLAYEVENIYDTCQHLMDKGVTINRPPRDGRMAFIKSPDDISIELLQMGESLPPKEPWISMKNSGSW